MTFTPHAVKNDALQRKIGIKPGKTQGNRGSGSCHGPGIYDKDYGQIKPLGHLGR